eukprot:m.77268 g.77268  ORF g.77268 m.77268 type:complete len:187 (-) comp11910_c1_seq1:1911-2471(-)
MNVSSSAIDGLPRVVFDGPRATASTAALATKIHVYGDNSNCLSTRRNESALRNTFNNTDSVQQPSNKCITFKRRTSQSTETEDAVSSVNPMKRQRPRSESAPASFTFSPRSKTFTDVVVIACAKNRVMMSLKVNNKNLRKCVHQANLWKNLQIAFSVAKDQKALSQTSFMSINATHLNMPSQEQQQ